MHINIESTFMMTYFILWQDRNFVCHKSKEECTHFVCLQNWNELYVASWPLFKICVTCTFHVFSSGALVLLTSWHLRHVYFTSRVLIWHVSLVYFIWSLWGVDHCFLLVNIPFWNWFRQAEKVMFCRLLWLVLSYSMQFIINLRNVKINISCLHTCHNQIQ